MMSMRYQPVYLKVHMKREAGRSWQWYRAGYAFNLVQLKKNNNNIFNNSRRRRRGDNVKPAELISLTLLTAHCLCLLLNYLFTAFKLTFIRSATILIMLL